MLVVLKLNGAERRLVNSCANRSVSHDGRMRQRTDAQHRRWHQEGCVSL